MAEYDEDSMLSGARGGAAGAGSRLAAPGPNRLARRGAFLVLLLVALVAGAWSGGGRLIREAVEVVSLRRVEALGADLVAVAEGAQLDPCLLAGIVYAESRGKPAAISSAGARGLMQLMQGSAEDAALRLGLPEPSPDELLDNPLLNLRLGTSHLGWLLKNRRDMSLEAVLVAYNAGLTKARRWFEAAGGYDAWRRDELRERRSGSLDYAIGVLRLRARFARRGHLHPPHLIPPE
ncbi:MAG: lytic transglycosylase domain-containing protein [Planctomycetota bacterium]|nr:hypothetical protein [Planctomycetota bacterium]MDP6370308.1 lytic transglycosylase domain-containing protein [Planctomycetota bacterium]MDP6956920.1 lytic transglycosylase domain-containing protein [Planctomycetota bacterium]